MQEIVLGEITSIDETGTAIILAPVPNIEKAMLRKYSKVEVGFCDGRHISPEQRRKCFALLNEIADYMGDSLGSTKETMKMDFVLNNMRSMTRKLFSLSDVSMETASDFISYLVNFIVEHNIPTTISLKDNCEDISKYMYAVGMAKRCCICGKPAQFCHYDSVGMGRDRTEIPQIGVRWFPACAEHHQEAHQIGHDTWLKKYHVQPLVLDKEMAKRWGLSLKNMRTVNERG